MVATDILGPARSNVQAPRECSRESLCPRDIAECQLDFGRCARKRDEDRSQERTRSDRTETIPKVAVTLSIVTADVVTRFKASTVSAIRRSRSLAQGTP